MLKWTTWSDQRIDSCCRESKTKMLEELQEELHILNKDIHQVETRQAGLPPASALLLTGELSLPDR